MSTDTETVQVTEDQVRTETDERRVAVRRFTAEITAGDGRTVSMRVVPFGEVAVAADGLGGVPRGIPYREEIMPGCFDKQLTAANRVLLNFEHQPGLAGVVGHGLALRRESDGYHGDFRIHEGPDGDKALTLVREGVLTGASFEALFLKSVRTAAGVVQRVRAHLDSVALCRSPAYAGAVVTGLRTEEEILIDEELLPVQLNPDVIERCRRIGVALPQRYDEAHPAETDTPAETGTSEDGTRPDQANADSEVGDEHDNAE